MTEHEWSALLGAEPELPAVVEESLQKAYDQIRAEAPPVRRPVSIRRGLRTALSLAGAAAVLCMGAAGIYLIARSEVPIENHGPAVEGLFGDKSRPSVGEQNTFDERGRQVLALPNEERVSVDGEKAETLLGEYLPDVGYVWQIGEYTLTVESYLLDEGAGAGYIYYILERPGGVEGITVSPEDGEAWANGTGIALSFCARAEGGGRLPMGSRTYADAAKCTADQLCLTAAVAGGDGWKAEDGLTIEFRDLRLNEDSVDRLDHSLVAVLELPGRASLPNVVVDDPDTGTEALRFSAIGMKLCATDIDQVGYVALEYADGARYVVKDDGGNLRNTSYELRTDAPTEVELLYCFNRLVEPEQVVKVIVDGAEYAVK